MNINDFKTPGQYLKALLDAREWSQRVLAIILEIDESLLTKIINNNRNIDAKTALLLGEVFEVDPEDFLSLQKKYDLEKAKIESRPDAGRAKRARIFGDLPISNMIKRGWIRADNVRDVPQGSYLLFWGGFYRFNRNFAPRCQKNTNKYCCNPITVGVVVQSKSYRIGYDCW